MKSLLKMILGVVMVSSIAFGAKEFRIGTGGQGGNYFTIGQDIVEACGQEVQDKTGYSINSNESTGSVENLNGLLNKKYSIGFVQADVYSFFKKKDQLNTIDNTTKKFINLYPEFLTILVPRGWKPKTNESRWSSLFSFGKNKTKPISIKSLKNQVVYAKGGAIVSAQALSYFMGLNLNIKDLSHVKGTPTGPIIIVTGSGDTRVQKLLNSGKYWLLSFNGNELANRASFYKPSKVTYIVKGKSVTANTVSIMSQVMVRKYRSKKRQNALKVLKKCLRDNIDDLVDDGSSNKWNLISVTNGWDKTQGEEDED